MLLVNLRMDATFIKEGMNIKWAAGVCHLKFSNPLIVCREIELQCSELSVLSQVQLP